MELSGPGTRRGEDKLLNPGGILERKEKLRKEL